MPPRPLIVGEVLFDCFPDRSVLGGAPFNVAWNLKALGADPLLLTAVGQDPLGDEVRAAMGRIGLDAEGLQVTSHPTGRVDIEVVGGEPRYRFWDDVAFDHIALPSAWDRQDPSDPSRGLAATSGRSSALASDGELASGRFGLLYHGSLALRGAVSDATVRRFREVMGCPVFIDVNIRKPHFDPRRFATLLPGATHVKLNHEELAELIREMGVGDGSWETPTPCEAWADIVAQGRALACFYSIPNLWVTAGEKGAAWIGPAGHAIAAAPPVTRLVDTVGAGDAFAAVIIRDMLEGKTPAESLPRAARFASRICGLRGATTENRQFYHEAIGGD